MVFTVTLALVKVQTYHGIDLWLPSLCHVDDIDTIVVEVLYAAMEIFMEKRPRLARQRDSSETELE